MRIMKSYYDSFSKKQKVVFLLFWVLSGFIWLGITPFLGQYAELVNDYWNFGVAMRNGSILYVDILDHKGPYTYFPYMFMAFFSRYSMSAYCVSTFVAGMIFYLILFWYILAFRNKNVLRLQIIITVSLFVYCGVWLSIPFFQPDGILAISLFFILRSFLTKKDTPLSSKGWFLVGALFGFLFWSKYALILILFPFYAWEIYLHVRQKTAVKLFKLHFIALGGFVVLTLPIVIWSFSIGNWNAMINNYFFAFSGEAGLPWVYWMFVAVYLVFSILFLFSSKVDGFPVQMLLVLLCMGSLICSATNPPTFYTCIIMASAWVFILADRQIKANICVLMFGICYTLYAFSIFAASLSDYIMCPYSIRTIAKENDIRSHEIIYFCEDFGFGNWSGDGAYAYQWLPEKLSVVREPIALDIVKEQTPKYVFALSISIPDELSGILDDKGYELFWSAPLPAHRAHGWSFVGDSGCDMLLYKCTDSN